MIQLILQNNHYDILIIVTQMQSGSLRIRFFYYFSVKKYGSVYKWTYRIFMLERSSYSLQD